MKLRNKKTGEIGTLSTNGGSLYMVLDDNGVSLGKHNSLAELNKEWEDVLEEPKEYYFINSVGGVIRPSDTDDWEQEDAAHHKQIGNYFEAKEEAEQAVEKLKAWKRLKDNGFKIKGWKFTPDMKQIEGNYVKIEAEIPQILINEKDIDLLFGGEE